MAFLDCIPCSSLLVPRLAAGLLSEKNVKLSMVLSVLGALVSTMAHGHIFSVFIFELFGDNSSVGFMDSVSGTVSLVVAIPVGIAVDKMPRTKLLGGCAVAGLLAAVTGGLAVVVGPHMVGAGESLEEPPSVPRGFVVLMMISLALWGAFFTATTSCSLALFTDSVPSGSRRTDLFATKTTVTLIGHSSGPLLALLCTVFQGNDWKLTHMSYALIPGFALMPVMCWLLTLYEEVDASKLRGLQRGLLEDESPKAAGGRQSSEEARTEKASIVPYVVLVSELITAVGAGMTVKFFGLWFKNVFKFSPAGLCAIQAVTPLAIAVAVQVLSRVVRLAAQLHPGGSPVTVMLVFWMAATGCLVMMTRVEDWRLLVLLHLSRTALANCKEPLTRAILADSIPTSQRGRWNAVHSLTSITWTGSAALGGVLCDRYGYGQTFIFTAGLYSVAALLWVPLIPLVPHSQSKKKVERHKRFDVEEADQKEPIMPSDDPAEWERKTS
eukprot:TRINITY_DN22717_c0_g1_i2.p1 TRINITY_DN22717_c0_g1~~TRINITY_DN22717_c0_g1_i2.p1  ORF type:complete len:496 (+),score=71.10 TRINITY_DN22717_c0_g1_i2:77-1564(+)